VRAHPGGRIGEFVDADGRHPLLILTAVEHDLADVPALHQSVGATRRVVDTTFAVGARHFFRSLVEGAKGAWRLGGIRP
jgi:hypothetical protein